MQVGEKNDYVKTKFIECLGLSDDIASKEKLLAFSLWECGFTRKYEPVVCHMFLLLKSASNETIHTNYYNNVNRQAVTY